MRPRLQLQSPYFIHLKLDHLHLFPKNLVPDPKHRPPKVNPDLKVRAPKEFYAFLSMLELNQNVQVYL